MSTEQKNKLASLLANEIREAIGSGLNWKRRKANAYAIAKACGVYKRTVTKIFEQEGA